MSDERDTQTGAPQPAMTCVRCKIPMQPMEAHFSYLKRSFKHTVQRCPQCGQVYIPEDVAEGRMKQVETALEDK